MIRGFETWNADFIDQQYRLWKENPNAIDADWHSFFQGFDLSMEGIGPSGKDRRDPDAPRRQARVETLTYRYRDLGHLLCCLDPLAACPTEHPLLLLEALGLSAADLDQTFYTDLFPGSGRAPLRQILQALKETYCRSIGVEYMHLQDPGERKWLQDRMEPNRNRPVLSLAERLRILEKLHHALVFEGFLNKKYPGQTRFSLEGAEALIPTLDFLLTCAAEDGCQEIILGMAHRGRLNVQANVLHKSFRDIFCEFEGTYDPADVIGAGDVKYHKGYLTDIKTYTGKDLRVVLMDNSSHLESVDPVVEGCARARQDMGDGGAMHRVMPLLIHGDAAFAGQGIVAEVLNMSQLEGYRTGGTVHLVLNNQIGYTTVPEDARSTRYSTDIAKMLMVPIFHVHGENPEAAVHAVRLACEYRMRFGKDVVVDIVCFRRYGHNEGDEPYFTQPQMYERIKDRPPLAQLYGEQLVADGIVDSQHVEAVVSGIDECMELAYEEAKSPTCPLPVVRSFENWKDFHGRFTPDTVDTRVAEDKLLSLARKLNTLPPGFSVHPKLQRFQEKRAGIIETGEAVDWAFAEALAFATLLSGGIPIRLSGQDSRRGTFSQRHSHLVDARTSKEYVPLNHLEPGQAIYECFNSLLSESGVLGFEYGYSLARPECLTLWEAQFGDFVNNAQSMVDLYIASGESKWRHLSGLAMLLPHGYEGMGPEHSSGRLERFLSLCAEDNLQVSNPTTPAQYFHLLRRQGIADFRKPLIIMTPKSLMRHADVVSSFEDLAQGGFQAVLDDPERPAEAERILLCCGKIYYELHARRQRLESRDMALVRIEQLHPFPEGQLRDILAAYPRAKAFSWVQEEPENMGAWTFVRHRLDSIVKGKLAYVGRKPAASPATGLVSVYRREQNALLEEALG
jgi:2-oxoglutarate dehydrogenase E1 component